MSWLSGQRKPSVAHQSQRIVAQMHEILQSKNAKIEKLEIVINELQDACTAVLEEELEALHRHRKWLEDEMAAVDEMISAKTAKLEELREETAKISNLVHEDDITKAVELLRKSSKKRSGSQRSPRPDRANTSNAANATPAAPGARDERACSASEVPSEEQGRSRPDDSSISSNRPSNSEASVPRYQQLLDEQEIRSEISAEEDDFESLDPGVDTLPDGTPVDNSSVVHQGVDEGSACPDEDVIEGLELLTTLRETDASVMFIIHRDAIEDVAGVSLAHANSNPTLEMFKFDCEQSGWPKEEIKFLERSTFYRFTPLPQEAGSVFVFQLSLLPDRVISVSRRSEQQFVCYTAIAGVSGAILDRIFVSSKSTWGFSVVGTVDLFGRHPETGVLLHERFKVWETAQQPTRPGAV